MIDKLPPARLHRDFGIGLSILLAIFAAFSWSKGGPWPHWIAGSAAALALAFAFPAAYGPVYRVWMPAALWLAKINTFLLLGLIYYVVITPYAAFLRLCGVRFLEFGWKDGNSYWKTVEPRDATRTLKRQF